MDIFIAYIFIEVMSNIFNSFLLFIILIGVNIDYY